MEFTPVDGLVYSKYHYYVLNPDATNVDDIFIKLPRNQVVEFDKDGNLIDKDGNVIDNQRFIANIYYDKKINDFVNEMKTKYPDDKNFLSYIEWVLPLLKREILDNYTSQSSSMQDYISNAFSKIETAWMTEPCNGNERYMCYGTISNVVNSINDNYRYYNWIKRLSSEDAQALKNMLFEKTSDFLNELEKMIQSGKVDRNDDSAMNEAMKFIVQQYLRSYFPDKEISKGEAYNLVSYLYVGGSDVDNIQDGQIVSNKNDVNNYVENELMRELGITVADLNGKTIDEYLEEKTGLNISNYIDYLRKQDYSGVEPLSINNIVKKLAEMIKQAEEGELVFDWGEVVNKKAIESKVLKDLNLDIKVFANLTGQPYLDWYLKELYGSKDAYNNMTYNELLAIVSKDIDAKKQALEPVIEEVLAEIQAIEDEISQIEKSLEGCSGTYVNKALNELKDVKARIEEAKMHTKDYAPKTAKLALERAMISLNSAKYNANSAIKQQIDAQEKAKKDAQQTALDNGMKTIKDSAKGDSEYSSYLDSVLGLAKERILAAFDSCDGNWEDCVAKELATVEASYKNTTVDNMEYYYRSTIKQMMVDYRAFNKNLTQAQIDEITNKLLSDLPLLKTKLKGYRPI